MQKACQNKKNGEIALKTTIFTKKENLSGREAKLKFSLFVLQNSKVTIKCKACPLYKLIFDAAVDEDVERDDGDTEDYGFWNT